MTLLEMAGESQLLKAGREWLVADQRGGFAMGTARGIRTRKYHGFFQGVAGRAEFGFLSDFEMQIGSIRFWPHLYQAEQEDETIRDPQTLFPVSFKSDPCPSWEFTLPTGKLKFEIWSAVPGSIALRWAWNPTSPLAEEEILRIRPMLAMRPLHAVGGNPCECEPLDGDQFRFVAEGGAKPVYCRTWGPSKWEAAPLWYRQFFYSEERERGYAAQEDIFSPGQWITKVSQKQDFALAVALSQDELAPVKISAPRKRVSALDFVLTRPAGVIAGFPWFGEWGRDTFISLPGIAAAWARSEGKSGDKERIATWTREVLRRWGHWIESDGMLPNLIGRGEEPNPGVQPQWDSADATLWWCHSLAALWQFSMVAANEEEILWPFTAPELESEFLDLLSLAIRSISEGRHRHLRLAPNGLLQVVAPHTTWMDARMGDHAFTPRHGFLPEINALWFQARCLHHLWNQNAKEENAAELLALANETLRLSRSMGSKEALRPNLVFLHSVPLAPSFVLRDQETLSVDMEFLHRELLTPVGLRTLSPNDPAFVPRYEGPQEERDAAYHQGTVWAWLGGHYEMAQERLFAFKRGRSAPSVLPEVLTKREQLFYGEYMEKMPIEGHIAEIFDAVEPFSPRGAPAQAWSLACHEEAVFRKDLRADAKITQVLARRWLGRQGRTKSRKQKPLISPGKDEVAK